MRLSNGMEIVHFNDGRHARRQDAQIADCPHRPGPARNAWVRGWSAENDVVKQEQREAALAEWRGQKCER